MANGAYSRIYHVLKDEYPDVWNSDAQLALFVRLLLVADKWYPEWAPLPARNGAYRSLLASGLLIENTGGNGLASKATGYTIRGLQKERGRRSNQAKHAANVRWPHGSSNATGNAPSIPSSNADSMPSREEKEKRREENGENPVEPVDKSVFMGFPSKKPGHTKHDFRGPDDCFVCHPRVVEKTESVRTREDVFDDVPDDVRPLDESDGEPPDSERHDTERPSGNDRGAGGSTGGVTYPQAAKPRSSGEGRQQA